MSSIHVDHIVKTYNKGQVLALNEVSFTVNPGEMFGLIGPDGAGKTSLFRILTTLLLPDRGSATLAGYDLIKQYKNIRSIVGYMPGRFSLYQDLSVQENLQFFATVFNTSVSKNYALIKDIYVQLEPFKHRRAGKLSGGMKQKLALCCALIHQPQILFLDEPTTGVDAVSRKDFWEMLKKLQQQGITMLISTSYMDEASLCNRIGFIQHGQLNAVDSPQKIIQGYPHKLYAIKAEKTFQLLKHLRLFTEISSCYSFGEYLHFVLKEPVQKNLMDLKKHLIQQGHPSLEIKPIEPTIEDCFIAS